MIVLIYITSFLLFRDDMKQLKRTSQLLKDGGELVEEVVVHGR